MLLHVDRGWIPSRAAGRSNFRTQWEFYAVLKGRCAPILEGVDAPWEPREKTLWVFSPECGHRWACQRDQAFHRIVLHFESVPPPLDKIVRERGYLAKALDDDESIQLERIAADLESHFHRPARLSRLVCESGLMNLAAIALARNDSRVPSIPPGAPKHKMAAALAWYDEHLAERPSVADVARAVGLPSQYLRCLFRQVHDANPKAVFQQVRLDKAQQLLRQAGLTLDEVAHRCGYTGASHLCREHKNLRQQTPRQSSRDLEAPRFGAPAAQSDPRPLAV